MTEPESAAPAATSAPAPAPAADWRAGLPDELSAHPALGRFKDVAGLAREHVNLQGLIGRKGLVPPTDRDPPEVWGRFWGALGRPESPEGYDFAKPDNLDFYSAEMADGFRAAAHEAGLTARQAAALHDWFVGRMGADFAAHSAELARSATQAKAELRREWGRSYDSRIEAARRAARHFADEESVGRLEEALGGPAVLRMFARVGELLGEDSVVGDGARSLMLSPGDAEAEINKVMGDPKHPYWHRLHPQHRDAVSRVEALFGAKG